MLILNEWIERCTTLIELFFAEPRFYLQWGYDLADDWPGLLQQAGGFPRRTIGRGERIYCRHDRFW